MVNVQETEEVSAVRQCVSVYSHTREPPDGGKGGGIRNIYIVIICQSYIDTWTILLPADRYTTSPNELSITTPPFPRQLPHPPSYGLFRAQENRNILYQLSITYIPFLR